MCFHRAPGKPLASGFLALILATAAMLPAAAAARAGETDLRTELDALFTEAYPGDGPGAAVLVTRSDELVLRKGYGMAHLELGVPVAPDMVFRLGSITKQFTAAAILLLVEDGKLSLDATLGEVLPDYDGPAARVTVHQLLTHTAGVPSYTEPDEYRDRMREDVTPEAMIERFRDEPLEFEPGTDWKYSNSGYFLLGAVIEELSGTGYEEFVESRIFEPLGMHRTLYGRVAEIVPGRVEGYQGEPGSYENAAYLSMTQPYAAGSLLSTVDDLALWDRALRADELLPAKLRDLLWTPAELADDRSTGYGYGFVVNDYQGHRIVRHGGGINGFTTAMVRIPDAQVFAAVLSNNPSAQPGPGELALEAATRALGEPLGERPSVFLDPERLDEYVGVYRILGSPDRAPEDAENEATRIVTREGDQLYTQRTGGSKSPVSFSGEDRFFYAESLTTGRFARDEDGRVTGMWIHQSAGPDEWAVKTDRPLPEEPEEVEIDPAILDRYPGRYRLSPGFWIDVTREGDELFVQATGQPKLRILPESETRFFLEEVDAAIEFHGAADGRAHSLTLFQAGQEMEGERIEE